MSWDIWEFKLVIRFNIGAIKLLAPLQESSIYVRTKLQLNCKRAIVFPFPRNFKLAHSIMNHEVIKLRQKSPLIESQTANLSLTFWDVSEIDSTIFWPTWQGSNEIETSVDVNSYLKNAFANKFRAEINDGWILSMNVDNFVSWNYEKSWGIQNFHYSKTQLMNVP